MLCQPLHAPAATAGASVALGSAGGSSILAAPYCGWKWPLRITVNCAGLAVVFLKRRYNRVASSASFAKGLLTLFGLKP